jgi:hypothetical protein
VNLSGVNGNVIMSGCGDDNPDDERGESVKDHTKSVSRRSDGSASGAGVGTQRAAVLAVKKGGAKGLVHGNRGRPSKRKIKEKTVQRIVELAQGKYKDFNDHHLTGKLEAEEKIELSREKVRRILCAHGMASPNKRRGIEHRSRRERRAAEGMILQVDGSPDDWLQGLNAG